MLAGGLQKMALGLSQREAESTDPIPPHRGRAPVSPKI